jgi:ATP-dependent Clp protease protease subunit
MAEEKETRSPAEVAADLALKQADLTLKELEADEKRAAVRKAAAEARKSEAEAAAYDIDLAAKQEARQATLANDHYYRVYNFSQQVSEASVTKCIDKLTLWSRIDPGCDIEVIFNSPGGSVVDGMALFDFLQELRRAGHHITTTAMGIAASMAGILLQAGDHRRMGKEAWVLIHQASFGAQGSYGSVEDTVEWVRKVQERILDIFANRSTMKRATIKKNWERKDWWLSSDECLRHGFVDEVL